MNLRRIKQNLPIKINREHSINADNIDRVEKKENIIWIYKKTGYPKKIKLESTFNTFLLDLVNAGVSSDVITEIKNKYK